MHFVVHAPLDLATSHGDKSTILVVFDPGRDLWYLNHANGFQYSCNMCWPALHDSAGVPQWINAIQAFDQRRKAHQESQWVSSSS